MKKWSYPLALLWAVLVLSLQPAVALSETAPDAAAPEASEEPFKRVEFVFEPDAYYSDVEMIVSLTNEPMPRLGEKTEQEIYALLLSRAAILPQFILFEASFNPLPYLGTYIRNNHPGFYEDAQVSGSFNWVKALTAGFEEPWAVSVLAGNVVGFDVAGRSDVKGNGYSGYLFSAGNYHIKDNKLIRDRWREFEWKLKGDRKSPEQKLNWSFRIGAKLHANPYITDIFYLSFRRSRLDYRSEGWSFLDNSGFEYTVDFDRRTLKPMRHYFLVDKKWPLESRKMALALAVGFVWESESKYTGPLAAGEGRNFQFLLRPNLEF